ncbi:sensor histidine kinase [Streptomyces sp. BE303]|uniref:sensor histidine kinase n=1 Tax=Streptomyces sp. BE303 TaxID=3002528 RepID=UPI002E784E92|nr:ATP-binding protein [Streptomyces sp. BE303]MED7951516.1 histidine kinase [Streptomyces sp. BE303]
MIGRTLAALAVPGVAVLALTVRRRHGPATPAGAASAAVTAAVAAAVSLAVTAATALLGRWEEADRIPALAALAELAALILLVVLALRHSRRRPGSVSVAAVGLAVALWPSRFEGADAAADPLTLTGFGAVLVVPAALAGLYLRGLDDTRRRSVETARRAQRIELAHDLHDFVAHDVSGMVALAQAGTVLAAADPVGAAALFERIEKAGQQALGALDRTVDLLRTPRDQPGAERAPQPGLEELASLVDRFASSGRTSVQLEAPEEDTGVPREVAATAYRVVVEALTNVRRHAPAARAVVVRVLRVGGGLEVTVADDGTGGAANPGPRRGGGSGLAGLAARVEALGGTLTAGRGDGGWLVTARMPLEGR